MIVSPSTNNPKCLRVYTGRCFVVVVFLLLFARSGIARRFVDAVLLPQSSDSVRLIRAILVDRCAEIRMRVSAKA